MTMTFTVLDASNSARVTVCHTERSMSEDIDVITLSDIPAVLQVVAMARRKPGWSDLSKLWVTVTLPAGSTGKAIDAMHRAISRHLRGNARRHPLNGLVVSVQPW